MKKIRLAFIGCGGITRLHLEHGLAAFPDVEFAGWCDLNAEAAAELAKKHGGTPFTQAATMLDRCSPDAVYIMLPPFAHGEAEQEVLKRKLPFFVEKPIHLDYREASRFAREVRKLKLITGVGYMNRFRKGIQRVKSLLEKQPLVMLHGGWLGGGPTVYEGIWKWWVQKDKSGGQLLEQTTHTTDLALYLGGPVEEVYAAPVSKRFNRPDFFTIEDASMVTLRYASGAVGNLMSSVATRVGGGIHLTVYGTDFRADFAEWIHNLQLALPAGEKTNIPGEDKIFAFEDRAFIDAVRTGRRHPILASYEDGLAAAAIAEAAHQSFAKGKPIRIADLK